MDTSPRVGDGRGTSLALVSCCGVACLGAPLFAQAVGSKWLFSFLDAAPGIELLLGAALLALLGLCAAFARLGQRRVPPPVFLALAVVPWALGVLFALRGMGEMRGILDKVRMTLRPGDVMNIVSLGVGEQLGAHAVGTWAGASLLLGAAVGWIARSLRTKPPGLLPAGALLLAWGLYGSARAVSSVRLAMNLREASLPGSGKPLPLLDGGFTALVPLSEACLATLGLAVLTSLGYAAWRLRRGSEPGRLRELGALAVLLVLTLLLDGLPLHEGVQFARAFSR